MKKPLQILITFLIIIIKSQSPINSYIKETNFFPGSEPKGLILINDNLIFAANTGLGIEPHKYNLQTNSVDLIKNINNTSSDSMIKNEFYKIDNSIFYFATDNSNLQLWTTDLATNTTSKVKDLNIYYPNLNNIVAKVLNNKLYFVFQQKLYVSDGTTNGTLQITNTTNVGNYLFENNGYVFFFGNSINYGREIWKTDGTVDGTSIVKDINPGSNSSIVYGYEKMYQFNNKIVFIARDSNYNLGLWSTDGSSVNTVSFFTLTNNPTFYDFDFQNYDKLLFTVNGDLWKTDGTSFGTNLIYNNIPTINKLSYYKNKIYIDTNTNLFYVNQSDQVNYLTNYDGTIFQTISPSNNGNYLALREYNNNSSPIYFYDDNSILHTNIKFTNDTKFIEYQNRLIFSGYIDSYQYYNTTYKNTELFSYDPLNNISNIEKDLIYNSYGTPRYYTEVNGEVYFLSRDGNYYQVYKIDSNNNLVKLSDNLNETFPDNLMNHNPVTVSGNFIYFHNSIIYRTNTITNSTEQISPPINEKIYGTYSPNNNKAIIKTYNSTDKHMRIWSLENNSTNFNLLIEKYVNDIPSSLLNADADFVKTDTGIYFKIINNSTTEIWKSDGTEANTFKITDLTNMYAFNFFLDSVNNKIFFSDRPIYSYNSTKLYYIDENTNQVNFVKDSYYNIYEKSFIRDNKLYFLSGTGNGDVTALNVTDGTLENTQTVTLINSEGAYDVVSCGNLSYFLDYHRQKIFATDGTISGTVQVTTGAQNFSSLKCMNNEIYGINSMQKVFRTNGNSGNYQELSFAVNNQVLQQPNYTWIKSLYAHNSKIYFSVDQYENHGEELFVTDQISTLEVSNENIFSNDKILIYPNPVTNEFKIKLNNGEKIIKVMISDINGRIISTHNNTLINVQNLSAGIYFLCIATNLNNYYSKVIKK
ncbi:T9SS type A sorting domain-containing protein [Chryseobacterium koreense]